jgi:hypothetical protein
VNTAIPRTGARIMPGKCRWEEAPMVKREHGVDRCVICGAIVSIPPGKTPVRVLHGASGKPNVRIIKVDGVEIHRCESRTE